MKKKLLSVIFHLSTGGAPQVLAKRIELIKDDVDVYVVEFNNYSDIYTIQKNRIKKLLEPGHFFTLGENKDELLDIIEKVQPNFLHMEEIPELFNISFDLTSKIYRKDRPYKIFETTHSSDFNVDDKIFFPDKFLFVSQYNCFKFNKFGIPSEVIEYPVEKIVRTPEQKADAMKKLNLDPKFKHVVNVGLFTPRKNQAYAFEIARKMSDQPVRFHFIGNQADNFQDYWKPLLKNKPKNCILWNERDDVDTFLDACDLFLFTSMGFRWNKELNPLVIKEALEHQIPQFLFPLDVYNRKYDIEDTIHYLNGDINIDSGLIKNFLFTRKNMPWDSSYLHPYPPMVKYKIRAVHLLLEEDNRKSKSIKEFEKLKDLGIDYVQHINQRYTDTPPREFCARPYNVGRIEAYSLRGPHYGNYQSFKKAMFTEFTDDIDFLMILESDCTLTVPIEEFVDKVFQSCEHINERGVHYMSFGDNRNLRTGEMVSDNHGTITDWMYLTNKIIGIQCIMFPKFAKESILRSYETCLWDVTDLLYNEMFKYKQKAIAPRLTTQIEGVSTIQGENIEHFLLKDINTLISDKNEKDIIVEYNKEDERFYCCLSDFFKGDINDIGITIKNDDNKQLYNTKTILSPFNSNWILLYDYKKYKYLLFDFYHKDEFLFTKKVKLSFSQAEKNEITLPPQSTVEIKNIEYDEIDLTMDEYFNLDYKVDENRLYFPYSGKVKAIFNVTIRNIDTKDIIFTSNNMLFDNKDFINWVAPGRNDYKDNPNFRGFSVDYQNGSYQFTKELVVRDNKPKTPKINQKDIFLVMTYADTKIKEEITEQCIDNLSKTNKKIILSSHYPVSKELQNKVDYYLYDSYNPLIEHTLYNFYWSTIPEGKIEIKLDKLQTKSNLNQSLTVLNNIENAVRFAKLTGYDKIISVSYDFIFNDENLLKINELCKRIDDEGKNGYFMLYGEGDMKLLKTVFFIINTEFYISKFENIRTPEKYNEICKKLGAHNFLENYFYKKLIDYSNELIIEETDETKLFNNKDINLFSGVEYLTVLPVENDNKSFVVWFNSSNDKDDRRIVFEYDNNGDKTNYTHFVKNRSFYFKKLTLKENDNYNISVSFIDSKSNEIISVQKFNVNEKNISELNINGRFIENKNI